MENELPVRILQNEINSRKKYLADHLLSFHEYSDSLQKQINNTAGRINEELKQLELALNKIKY